MRRRRRRRKLFRGRLDVQLCCCACSATGSRAAGSAAISMAATLACPLDAWPAALLRVRAGGSWTFTCKSDNTGDVSEALGGGGFRSHCWLLAWPDPSAHALGAAQWGPPLPHLPADNRLCTLFSLCIDLPAEVVWLPRGRPLRQRAAHQDHLQCLRAGSWAGVPPASMVLRGPAVKKNNPTNPSTPQHTLSWMLGVISTRLHSRSSATLTAFDALVLACKQ